jgi:hypothetical protein
VTECEYAKAPSEYKHNGMGKVCPPSQTPENKPDVVIKGLKLDKRAGGLYSETSKVFYLFVEDCRGVVQASPLARKKSTRSGGHESIIYEMDESGLDQIKKLVYIPEKYEAKRPQEIRHVE